MKVGKLERYLLSWESSEVGRWKVSGFIEERGTQSEVNEEEWILLKLQAPLGWEWGRGEIV